MCVIILRQAFFNDLNDCNQLAYTNLLTDESCGVDGIGTKTSTRLRLVSSTRHRTFVASSIPSIRVSAETRVASLYPGKSETLSSQTYNKMLCFSLSTRCTIRVSYCLMVKKYLHVTSGSQFIAELSPLKVIDVTNVYRKGKC